MVKICYVASDVVIPHFRGASTHVYEVASHLAKLGHEVHVISRRINSAQFSHEVSDGFHIHRVYRGIVASLPFSSYKRLEGSETQDKTLGLLNKLYTCYLFSLHALYAGLITSHIIRKYNLEIIVERETSFGAGAIAATITKKPMILEIIGPRYSKFSFEKSKRILAYTESMIHGPVPQEKMVWVTAAADVESFRPNPMEGRLVREKYGLQNSIVIGYIGTFAKWHGVEELIDVSEEVLRRFPNVRFLMVGPYFGYAQELANKRGLSDTFVFTGPVPYLEVPKYINAADVLVAPYNPARSLLRRRYGVGSPLKVFEYMACEKCVITTSIDPITRVVEDGKTGILVPPGDREALSEAIIHLIEKPETARKIAKAARKAVVKLYSWRVFVTGLDKILKETLR